MKTRTLAPLALLTLIAMPGTARTTEQAAVAAAAVAPRHQAFVARAPDAATLHALATVRARTTEIDAHKRGGLAIVSPHLRTMPAATLLPLLDVIAGDRTRLDGLTDSARQGVVVGVIEAVGSLRDPRATPALQALVDDADPQVVRAATDALGNLGDDALAADLVARAALPGGKRTAILAGLGSCRRLAVARALAGFLASGPGASDAEAIVRSLGAIGSAWAWKTPALRDGAHRAEEGDVRSTAARALVSAFATGDDDLRRAASNALMVVDDPSTPSRIADEKVHHPGAIPALDALLARFARNPAR